MVEINKRKAEHHQAVEISKRIVELFVENNLTIRQAKTALNEAKKSLADVTIHPK
ncbi:hypothetical protein [Virgibacillus oceani]|uniref:Uncharacterized protein n=1 Tax=Virgibacillus oceani TaxID=1479511 RepID=A0A917H278_9BACI|nr:hypothetical protein [Virgibacillus oceani]GGG64485.1 hypothetical protein GCM10011398_05090 [Virgibacillus oceani]